MSNQCKIELHNISKRYNIYDRPIDRLKEIIWRNKRCYHKEFWSLNDITVKFDNCVTAILGPNGSGKSTLLQIIAGVLRPTQGTIARHGRVTAILELGAGFQPDYTGRENVLLNGMMLGISEAEMIHRMPEIAEFAEVGDFFDQPLRTYSSGMAMRLAFASAINVDPEILLIDEALAVGDERFQLKCFEKIDELKIAGKTIVFVSHNTKAVEQFCQQAIVLNGGRLIAQGKTKEIIPIYEKLMDGTEIVAPKTFTQPSLAH